MEQRRKIIVERLNPICVGADIGQLHDPSAISVAEVIRVETGRHRYIKPVPAHIDKSGRFVPAKDTETVMRSEYMIRFIKRLPLGTSYPDVALYLADMLCKENFQRRSVSVFLDVTGVGRPVFQDLQKEIELRKETRHIHLNPISFVHGEMYNRSKGTLGKAFLVSRLQSLLQGGRVHAPDTSEVRAMLEELRVYEVKISDKGTDTYGAKTGAHDDLATALALSTLEDPYALQIRQSERVH